MTPLLREVSPSLRKEALLRRDFNIGLCLLALTPYLRPSTSAPRGPLFWRITRGRGRVFLMGFGDAKTSDESWLTPAIQRAFRESSELWLEVAPPDISPGQDAASKAKADAVYESLSHEPPGRTFFDELDPKVRTRTLACMANLGVSKEKVESLRPWSAYYAINSAFWSHQKLAYEPVYVDEVLRTLAVEQGKRVQYEMPSGVAFARFMAAMPQKAQSQYIEWLLDFFEDRLDDVASFGWMKGDPVAKGLDRMRAKMPQLYQSMQVQRNSWWARKINDLLASAGTYFVAIGELHVLGPDGIPNQLKRRGILRPSELRENPSVNAIG